MLLFSSPCCPQIQNSPYQARVLLQRLPGRAFKRLANNVYYRFWRLKAPADYFIAEGFDSFFRSPVVSPEIAVIRYRNSSSSNPLMVLAVG